MADTKSNIILNIITGADVKGVKKLDTSLKNVQTTVKKTTSSVGFLSSLMRKGFGLVGINSFRDAFSSYLQFEKDLGAMRSRFYAITKDERQADEEFEYIRKLATDTASDIKSTADSYSIFYASARNALGKQGARGVFEAWTKVGRVLHLNEQSMDRVTYALREMSSKGQLYSQDLKMQLGTHVPDAVNIATQAIKNMNLAGVETVEDFQKLTKKNPKGGYMPKFLIEFSKEAERRFGTPEALRKAMEQPDALAKQIQNIGYNFMLEFSRKGGSYMIVKVLRGISDVLLSVDFNKITDILGRLAHYIGKTFDIVNNHLPLILEILKDIALSVAIFYTLKGLTSLFRTVSTFLRVFKGFSKTAPFITKVLYSLGSAVPAISKFLVGRGLKGILAGVLGLGGPLGWIANIFLFLPEIVSAVKWIASKIGWKSTEDQFKEKFGGLSIQSGYNILKDIQNEGGIKNQEDLNRRLMWYKGGENLVGSVQYVDQKHVKLEFNGIQDINSIQSQIEDKVNKPPQKNTIQSFKPVVNTYSGKLGLN